VRVYMTLLTDSIPVLLPLSITLFFAVCSDSLFDVQFQVP
jgi:hypothetical protein